MPRASPDVFPFDQDRHARRGRPRRTARRANPFSAADFPRSLFRARVALARLASVRLALVRLGFAPPRRFAAQEGVIEQPPKDWRVLEAPQPAIGGIPPLSRHSLGRILLAGAVVVLAASMAGTLWLAGTAGSAREVTLEAERSVPAISPREAELVVDVAGAVARPGVLRLAAGSRVADAIAAAGGFAPTVDAAAASATLNLAAPLQDGVKIVVPQRGVTSQAGGAPATRSESARVDLNTATQAELEALPGIGLVTAKKIIDARAEAPFRSLDDLTTRKLVGGSTFEKIRDLVSIGG